MRVQTLQALQQGLLERLDGLRQMHRHYPYGVVEMELARDALEAGKISFTRLRVILRNGLEVVVPSQCELESFPVRDELARSPSGELSILLGVPEYSLERPNALRPAAKTDLLAKYRYVVQDEFRPDENSGDNAQPIFTRTLNARLLFDVQDQRGLECLPLLRVRRAAAGAGAEFRIELVPEAVPPCLLLAAGPALAEEARLAIQLVLLARRRLARHLRTQRISLDTLAGAQIHQVIRLMALARHGARLAPLQQSPNTTPFEMFQALYEALCELEALRPGVDLEGTRLEYDHEDPFRLFSLLRTRLDEALREAEGVNYEAVEFEPEPQKPDRVRARLKPKFLGTNVAAYYLAIKTPLSVTEVAAILTDKRRFELTIPERLGQAFGGLLLTHTPNFPAGLPDAPDLHYFRVELTGNKNKPEMLLWDKVRAGGELAIQRKSPLIDLSNAAFTFYAIFQPRTLDPNDPN